jgi:hypothetical protein
MGNQRSTQVKGAASPGPGASIPAYAVSNPGSTGHPMLALQQTIGNRAVQRLVQRQSAGGAAASPAGRAIQRQGPDDIPPTLRSPFDPNASPEPQGYPTPEPYQPPTVPEVPEVPFEPIPPTLPSAGVGAGEGAAGLGAEAILPVALAGAAGAGAGYGMAKIADSSYTKTGAFGTDADTGKNQSAMDWGASWGTDWDKAHNQGQASVTGGALAAAGGIVGGIGGAVYGAGNWLADKL